MCASFASRKLGSHAARSVESEQKRALYAIYIIAQILCALCANFSLQYPVSNPRIAQNFRYCSTCHCSAHCVPFPILQYLALVCALYAYSRVVVPGIEESGRNAKIFHLRNPAALLGIPSLPFFDISKNLLCTNKRYQCVGAWQRIAAKACLLILRGIFLEGLKVFWRIPQKCFLEKLRLKTNQLCF